MTKYATISREEMENIIQGGGSVIYKGAVITQVDALPSRAELAGDDEKALDEVQEDLDARQKALDEERAKVKQAREARESKAPAEAGAEESEAKASEDASESAPPEHARRGK